MKVHNTGTRCITPDSYARCVMTHSPLETASCGHVLLTYQATNYTSPFLHPLPGPYEPLSHGICPHSVRNSCPSAPRNACSAVHLHHACTLTQTVHILLVISVGVFEFIFLGHVCCNRCSTFPLSDVVLFVVSELGA